MKRNGLQPEVENVFFTHGDLDPWLRAGVTQDVNETSPVVIFTGYSHSKDLYSISDADSEQMQETKMRIQEAVRNATGIW